MNITNNQPNREHKLTTFFCALIVFSSAMLATWTLGEILSVGGFTQMEMATLVIFSSMVLKITATFLNILVNIAVQIVRMETKIVRNNHN